MDVSKLEVSPVRALSLAGTSQSTEEFLEIMSNPRSGPTAFPDGHFFKAILTFGK